MYSETKGEPIPFIEIVDDPEEKKHIFTINPEAISILQEMRDRKIGVLVIAGPQRSGKSFLANRIVDKVKGFKLGSTVQPCTKGIWMWSQPVRLDDNHDFETIILDTEGLNSVERDQTIDTKIFTISLLLSSMFVYNSIGTIDEVALENLSLVINLAKYIDSTKEGGEKVDFSTFFPYFIWVLRDFALDTKGKTPKEYLAKCLQPVEGNSPEIQRKNQIRKTINSYFSQKDCQTLIRPVNQESELREMEKLPEKSIKREFLEGLEQLRRKIFQNIRPKIINGKTITGTMLLNLTFEYLEAINNDCAPQIYSTVERVIYAETRKICDDLIIEYHERSDEELSESNLPMDVEQLRQRFKDLSQEILKKFEDLTKEYADTTQLLELRNELVEKMENDFESKLQLNDDLSQHLCKKLINEFLNSFDLPSLMTLDDIKESTILEYKQTFLNFYDNYKTFAKGAHKFELFADCMPNFLFEFFKKYIMNANRLHNQEISDIKAALAQARAGEESLRKTLTENYDLVIELQKERDEIRRILDKNNRDLHLSSILKQDETEAYKERIQELEEKLARKKDKNKDLKKKIEELNLSIEKLKLEKNQLKRRADDLQEKVMELEKRSLDLSSSKDTSSASNTSDIKAMVSTLFKQIDDLRVSFQPIDASRVSEYLGPNPQGQAGRSKEEYEEKIASLLKDYKKLREVKEKYEADYEAMKRQVEIQLTENARLKAENFDLMEQVSNLKKKELMINALKNDISRLNEEYDMKKTDYRVSVQVTEVFKKNVEDINSRNIELENRIAYLQSENAQLKALKTDIVYACREAIKKAAKKSHLLREAIKSLDEESANEIRQVFKEVGIKIDY